MAILVTEGGGFIGERSLPRTFRLPAQSSRIGSTL